MLQKPTVPSGPVIVKDTVVVSLVEFDVIVALDIWELVMFPLIASSTVAPPLVIGGTVVTGEVGVGDGVFVGVNLGSSVGVGIDVGIGVAVEVTEAEFTVIETAFEVTAAEAASLT